MMRILKPTKPTNQDLFSSRILYTSPPVLEDKNAPPRGVRQTPGGGGGALPGRKGGECSVHASCTCWAGG